MTEQRWTKVAALSDLQSGKHITAEVDDEEILLVRQRGKIHAVSNSCPHWGAPLNEGVICGCEVVCPWHGSRFSLADGHMTTAPSLDGLSDRPVKIEDGEIFVGQKRTHPERQLETTDTPVFAIVGGGAAGNSAAERLRAEGFTGRVLLISADTEVPYDRPNLSKDFLAGRAEPEWIPLRNMDFYAHQKIEVLLETSVERIDRSKRRLHLSSGREITYDKVLLATGGSPKRLGVKGEEFAGHFLLRTHKDAKALLSAGREAKTAVVVGAGFIGMEAAASLKALGVDVHIVAPEHTPLERVLGHEVGDFLAEVHRKNGVHLHMGVTVDKIEGSGRVGRVTLSNGETLPADLVVTGAGITPVLDYLEGTELVEDGAVPVDSRLQTKDERIYAAGDIAAFPSPITKHLDRVEHWAVAQSHGRHAAMAMLGSQAPYSDVPYFWTTQFDVNIDYIGQAKTWDELAVRGSIEKGDFLAGYYKGGTLIAAASCKQSNQLLALRELLERGQSPTRQHFEHPETDFVAQLG